MFMFILRMAEYIKSKMIISFFSNKIKEANIIFKHFKIIILKVILLWILNCLVHYVIYNIPNNVFQDS
jgi:hypothetical protein